MMKNKKLFEEILLSIGYLSKNDLKEEYDESLDMMFLNDKFFDYYFVSIIEDAIEENSDGERMLKIIKIANIYNSLNILRK